MAASAGAVLLPVIAKGAPVLRAKAQASEFAFAEPSHPASACTLPGE